MGELLGSIAFTLIVIAVIAGAWSWISTLLRRGIMALIGFDRVCVQQFETVLLYRNGRFEKALPPGLHRIRAGSRQLARIDRRPEVFRFTQGAVSADRIAVNLVYAARTQIVDPRTTFESTQNYRDEISIRLQSVVIELGGQEIPAVDLEQRLSLADQAAGVVHVDLLDEPLELHVDV